MASTILSEQWYNDKKENFNDEKLRIITAIVNLITNEERCMQYENNVYPSNAGKELVAEFLFLMTVLVGPGLKQTSLSQCILKAM